MAWLLPGQHPPKRHGTFGLAPATLDECQLHIAYGVGAGGVIGCVASLGRASVSTEITGGPINAL